MMGMRMRLSPSYAVSVGERVQPGRNRRRTVSFIVVKDGGRPGPDKKRGLPLPSAISKSPGFLVPAVDEVLNFRTMLRIFHLTPVGTVCKISEPTEGTVPVNE